MDKLKELLTAQGYNDSDIETILSCIKESKFIPEGAIPKSRFDEVIAQKHNLEEQIESFNKQIEELGKVAGNNEELKKQIETLKVEKEKAIKEGEEKIKAFNKEQAIKSEFINDVYDADYVFSKLDLNNIIYDEKEKKVISGLKEQLESLKTNDITKIQFKEAKSTIAGGAKLTEGISKDIGETEGITQAELRMKDYFKTINKGEN